MLTVNEKTGEITYDTEEEFQIYKLAFTRGYQKGYKEGYAKARAEADWERIREQNDREWEERKRREVESLRRMEEAEKDRRIKNELWQLRNAAYNRKW